VVPFATTTAPFAPSAVVLAVEVLALFLGQRRLFWLAIDATGSRLLGYLLAMPGTVLREAAHYLACLVLRVPVGRQVHTRDRRGARVRLFHAQRDRYTRSAAFRTRPPIRCAAR
jgi:hypothetical protein